MEAVGVAVEQILGLVKAFYPDWQGLADPRFVDDEIAYKRKLSEKAEELLSQREFEGLLRAGDHEEIRKRLRVVAKEKNLLFISKMEKTDMGILYKEDLDLPKFCNAFYDLLYGEGDSPSRLERYFTFLDGNNLNNRWTLPTYFLFVIHPQTDYLVKPTVVKWLLNLMGNPLQYNSKPDAEWYGEFLQLLGQLRAGLAAEGVECTDMVELQSLIWVAFHQVKKTTVIDSSVDGSDKYIPPIVDPTPEHSFAEISKITGYPVDMLQRWERSIRRKKQAVFYGPPGTGKTFIADHLARHLIGGGRGFSQVVQFHPSYAYEDFIEGIRPSVNGSECLVYRKERGVFLEFCCKAAEAEGDPCVMIVDEINRAPLSRVFGELMYLLEYRNQKIRLASGREFAIPENVYLIGTMNTADRSIALVDHALRRRFAFISLFPEYGVLESFHAGNGFDASGLVRLLKEVNHEIGDRNYSVGVSFFLDNQIEKNMEDIWRMEIEPYLEEYFYDQNGKMEDFRWEKVRARVLGGAE